MRSVLSIFNRQLQLIAFRACLILSIAVITYLAVTSRQYPVAFSLNDKINHLLAFVILAWFVDFSFPGNSFFYGKYLLLLGYGIAIEVIQHYLPYREFSIYDMHADVLGILLYIGGIKVVRRYKMLRER